MFSVYDIQGRRFHDTLEKLNDKLSLKPVVKGKYSNGADLVSENNIQSRSATKHNRIDEPIVSNSAIEAYRQVRHLPQREPICHAYQLMSYPVRAIPLDMSIPQAQRHFQQYKYQQMPVINKQQRIVGMFSMSDLLQFIIVDGDHIHYLRDKKVADAMSKQVITTDPVSDIRRVAQAMQEYNLTAIPVADEQDKLVGILSRGDLLRAIINNPPLTIWS